MPGVKIATNQDRLNQLFDSLPENDSEIAKLIGVSKQTISAWRNGSRSPKKPLIEKIALLYDLDVAWLMGYDVPMRPEKETNIDSLTKDETHLVQCYRAAEPRYQSLALELLEEHPRKEESSISMIG